MILTEKVNRIKKEIGALEYLDVMDIIKSNRGYSSNNLNVPGELKLRAQRLCWEYNQTSPDEGEERGRILKELLGGCSELTFIEPSFRCDYGFNIVTHGLAVINYNCVILDTSPVDIGANAFIAPGVCLACSGHSIDAKQRAAGISTSQPIVIEDDVWIGANSVICGGVTIGKGSVIGAGSVVNKDIPPGVIAAGSPCKVIRKVTELDKIKLEDIVF